MVHHDQLAVRDTGNQLGCRCLSLLIEREMRTYNIIVILVKTRIKVVCEQFQILVVHEDRDVCLLTKLFCQ